MNNLQTPYGYQLAPSTNALGIVGLVLGAIVAGLSLALPVVSWFIVPLPALLAFIFGIVGLNTAARMGGLRRTESVWAVVLSLSPLPVGIIWFVIGSTLGG